MKISDKIGIKDEKYMCTQIILLKNLTVYRIHKILGNEEKFMIEKNNTYEQIIDEKILKEIYELLKVKNTDII